ncbi:hypothetical protein NLU13_7399 [Sarocladium strictum]|uniref:Uncharacterized protein n=1 Tax=Sarocladium strictum TaxID=5046 RepID=A0AA39L5P8_SARSR|nr:hypothetical protein NLU13_7399 [Sarocladium strictum]
MPMSSSSRGWKLPMPGTHKTSQHGPDIRTSNGAATAGQRERHVRSGSERTAKASSQSHNCTLSTACRSGNHGPSSRTAEDSSRTYAKKTKGILNTFAAAYGLQSWLQTSPLIPPLTNTQDSCVVLGYT